MLAPGCTNEMDELAHWVELQGCFNFRDLGDYRTLDGRRMRSGQVFRADGLHYLTDADLDHLRAGIGLGAVIDLRASDEIAESGTGGVEERFDWHHVPLFSRTREGDRSPREFLKNMGELYLFMLEAAGEPIGRVVRLLADSRRPIVFHCAAGKDRTGVISALLLSLLGVPEETIVMDYAFSRRNLDQINARLRSSSSYQALMDDLPEGAYEAEPETMVAFLERVRSEYGSMAAWAKTAGIGPDLVERLQRRLLV